MVSSCRMAGDEETAIATLIRELLSFRGPAEDTLSEEAFLDR